MSAEVERKFAYHRPTPERVKAHESVREGCRALYEFIDGKVPGGREKALALTSIETAMMWANAAIARAD
jgi:hypothetical protein